MEHCHGEAQAYPKADAEDDKQGQIIEFLEPFITVIDHFPLLKKLDRASARVNRQTGVRRWTPVRCPPFSNKNHENVANKTSQITAGPLGKILPGANPWLAIFLGRASSLFGFPLKPLTPVPPISGRCDYLDPGVEGDKVTPTPIEFAGLNHGIVSTSLIGTVPASKSDI